MISVDTEKQFEQELDCFRNEIEAGIQTLFTYLAVHATAHGKPQIERKLNATPYFWRTVLYSLQSTQFIVLGRIFDTNSDHNVHRLLKLAQDNPSIFSKNFLAERKRKGSANADEWLPNYLKHVHEPDATDFRRLRKHVKHRKNTYMNAYRDIRRKVFAHTEVTDRPAIDELFRRTTIDELKEIFVFMSKLYQVLWQMYHNGVKPVLKQQPHSVKKLLAKKHKPWGPKTIQELIVKDTQFLLRDMIEYKENPNC